MKKILSIIIVTVVLISGLVAAGGQKTIKNNTINDEIIFSNPTINEDLKFINLDLAEKTSMILEPGEPRLPIVTQVYKFPYGTSIKSIDVKLTYDSELYLTKKIMPNSDRTPIGSSNLEIDAKKDLTIYENEDFFPYLNYDYDLGGGRDKQDNIIFLKINLYPVQYSPKNDILKIASKARIEITYDKPTKTITSKDDYDLVIISPSDFSEALQPLVNHKNSKGVSTFIKNLEDIYDNYPGRDEAEQIKYFIFDAFEEMSISYVMLVGSIDKLPIRFTDVNVWETYGIPTDLYYADIVDEHGDFCSWDSNGNDDFGEFNWQHGPIDEVDLYADIGIGRLACSSIKEVETVVNKIITYETETYGESWFNNLITMGGDTFPNDGVIEGEFVLQEVIDLMPDFNPIKLWTSLNTFRPMLINYNINKGAGFVSYSGHGYTQGFGTSPPDVEDRIEYYSLRLIGMRNREKLPVFFFDACSTAELDFNWEGFELFYPPLAVIFKILKGSSYDPLELYPCFAWMLMKKENGGAIATIGATRVAFTHVDNWGIHAGASYLNVNFFEGYESGIAVSDMFIYAQNEYLNNVGPDCLTLEEFILLGDPSLKIGGYP